MVRPASDVCRCSRAWLGSGPGSRGPQRRRRRPRGPSTRRCAARVSSTDLAGLRLIAHSTPNPAEAWRHGMVTRPVHALAEWIDQPARPLPRGVRLTRRSRERPRHECRGGPLRRLPERKWDGRGEVDGNALRGPRSEQLLLESDPSVAGEVVGVVGSSEGSWLGAARGARWPAECWRAVVLGRRSGGPGGRWLPDRE